MYDRQRIVLITGGAGYIGSHAAFALHDAGYRALVVDDLSGGVRHPLPDVPFVQADVGDAARMRALFAAYDVGAIMHFAGSLVAPESVIDPLRYYANNVAASRTLVDEAVAAGVPHVVFSSTAAVYGEAAEPVREDMATAPINPYGRSKLVVEWLLADVSAAHAMNAGVLRYFNVAGADPGLRTGPARREATHLVKVAVQAALGLRGPVLVYGADYDTPDGTGVRDYIHVSDLVAAHVSLLERLAARSQESLTLNCGYGRGHSVLDVLRAAGAAAGRSVPHRFVGRREGDAASMVADNARIRAALDWQPAHDDLATIMRDALAWEAAELAAVSRSRPEPAPVVAPASAPVPAAAAR